MVLARWASQSRSKTSSKVSLWIRTRRQPLEALGKFQMILAWTRRCVYSLSAVMLTCVTFSLRGASNRGHRTDEAEMKDVWNISEIWHKLLFMWPSHSTVAWFIPKVWSLHFSVSKPCWRISSDICWCHLWRQTYIVRIKSPRCWCTSREPQSHLSLRLHYSSSTFYMCVLMHIISPLINGIVYRLIHYVNNWELRLHRRTWASTCGYKKKPHFKLTSKLFWKCNTNKATVRSCFSNFEINNMISRSGWAEY